MGQKMVLPLHMALHRKRSPLDIVWALLKANPAGARTRDKDGLLPMHLAARRTKLTTQFLQKLLELYPDAIHATDKVSGFANEEQCRSLI